jgi:hypothetical protein
MIEERVARLEAQMEEVALKADRQEKVSQSVLDELRSINLRLSKYQGFVGGVIFVGSCFYYAVMMGKEGIVAWWKARFG